ncbi:helix-turn-helix transcriptional regulator [Actinomadura sp. WMMB 499]|uniref:ArsR/SmtB family transcription factor n=1 Tax=Actinomadura sp. WMMB 499 TaxID=1219491 RepID=UPI001247A48D|nr:metalloregulator ArsR/SmtB family transcription factor [Actinomadura sp. WMMB 499]QFG23090.1 helix-turn-helix transcriptional regulator [Actinomadura sp. WMMB 499]
MLISTDADVVRALADPLRARIVELLADEALCVCHLVEETGARQTNISNHLRVLRDTGLVETEPCGRFTYYRLRPEPLRAASARLADLAGAAEAARAQTRKRPCP